MKSVLNLIKAFALAKLNVGPTYCLKVKQDEDIIYGLTSKKSWISVKILIVDSVKFLPTKPSYVSEIIE